MALPNQDQVNAVARNIASAIGGAVLIFGLSSKISPETITALANTLGDLINDLVTLIGLVSPLVMAYLAYKKSSQTSQVQSVQAMPGVEQITVNAKATPELALMATDRTESKVVPFPKDLQAVTAKAAIAKIRSEQ